MTALKESEYKKKRNVWENDECLFVIFDLGIVSRNKDTEYFNMGERWKYEEWVRISKWKGMYLNDPEEINDRNYRLKSTYKINIEE